MSRSLMFWLNMPSMHLSPTIQAIARQWDGPVTVATEADVLEKRVAQGWIRPEFTPAQLVMAPTWNDRLDLIATSMGADDVHIFLGIQAYPQTYRTLKHVGRLAPRIGIWAEPPRQNEGLLKTLLRRARYTNHAIRWRNRSDFFLTTGEIGQNWYAKCGFPNDMIFRFGYFFAAPENPSDTLAAAPLPETNAPVRIMFVGELEHHKGVDVLLAALSQLMHHSWELLVVGKGSLRETLAAQSKSLGLETRLQWTSEMPNSQLIDRMSRADLLVLPSRHDGWGAVVTEALSVGTPVLVSDACGAADVVSSPVLGAVFSNGDAMNLSQKLEPFILRGPLDAWSRSRVGETCSQKMHPDVVAGYFMRIIDRNLNPTVVVSPPWLEPRCAPR